MNTTPPGREPPSFGTGKFVFVVVLAIIFFRLCTTICKSVILRGFMETRILALRSAQRRHLHQNGQNCGFAVEMTLRGIYGAIFAEGLLVVPRSLGTRTKRGFPHSHSDYGDG